MAVLLIAFVSSLKAFRLDISHYKVISIILATDLVVETAAMILVHFHRSNVPIYNFNLLAEFWLYGYYFFLLESSRRVKGLIRIYLWLLPLVWMATALLFHIKNWNSYFTVLGSVSMVLLSARYYYRLFTAQNLVKLSSHFEFWVATALIFYHACNLPYLGMLNLLTKRNIPGEIILLILQVLNIIFYLILAFAFICTIPIKKSS